MPARRLSRLRMHGRHEVEHVDLLAGPREQLREVLEAAVVLQTNHDVVPGDGPEVAFASEHLTAIDEGLRMAAQSGHLPWASLLRLEAASLHTEALDFAGAAAIAREELRGPSLTQAGRQRAMFELAFAHLGLGEFDEAYAAFTAPQLVAAAGIEAMPWSGQVLLRRGLGQLWLARGKLDRAHREAEALHDLAAAAADPPLRASAARLLAEIALEEGRLSQAETFLRDALAAIEGYEVPVVRGSFLGHRSVREVLGPRGAGPRSRRRS